MQYTIKAVNPKTRTYETKFGEMVSYQVVFEESEGAVDISQKTTTPAPKVGDVVEGTIDVSGAYGPKFKKDFSAGSSFGGGAKSTGGQSTGGKFQADPFTMYLSYAKDLVVILQDTTGFDKAKFQELLKATLEGGKALYDGRPGAEPKAEAKPAPEQSPLTDVFGNVDIIEEEELPWNPSK